MGPIESYSTIGFLMSPAGLVMLIMALVVIALVAYFVPGGMKKVISITLVAITFGIGLLVLKKRKNKLIEMFNEDLKKYQDLLTEKEKNDAKIGRLTVQNKRLDRQEKLTEAKMEEHYNKYLDAKKETAHLEAERVQLAATIDARSETLDDAYEFGTAARFRSQWEAAKRSAHVAIETPAPAIAGVASVQSASINDPNPLSSTATIDIAVGRYRLKGDV